MSCKSPPILVIVGLVDHLVPQDELHAAQILLRVEDVGKSPPRICLRKHTVKDIGATEPVDIYMDFTSRAKPVVNVQHQGGFFWAAEYHHVCGGSCAPPRMKPHGCIFLPFTKNGSKDPLAQAWEIRFEVTSVQVSQRPPWFNSNQLMLAHEAVTLHCQVTWLTILAFFSTFFSKLHLICHCERKRQTENKSFKVLKNASAQRLLTATECENKKRQSP